jgi:nitrogen regulatory protein PII
MARASTLGGGKPRLPLLRSGRYPAGKARERFSPVGRGVEGQAAVKEVIAIVKPFLAERVLEALKLAPLEACTVREVKGYGRQKSYLDQYGDSEYSLAFLPKVEIQLWVEDARVAEVVERITAVARTGRIGDGKIFVLPACEHVSDAVNE